MGLNRAGLTERVTSKQGLEQDEAVNRAIPRGRVFQQGSAIHKCKGPEAECLVYEE